MSAELLPYTDLIVQMIDTAIKPVASVMNILCFGNKLSSEQKNQDKMWLQTVKPECVPVL